MLCADKGCLAFLQFPSDDAGLHENEMASSPSLGQARLYFGRSTSLAEHGEWCQEFRRMGLPSFRPTYLFLVRVPLDVVHECLRLRLEQRPQGDPSFLSIRQVSVCSVVVVFHS